jgi:hypothetical protein
MSDVGKLRRPSGRRLPSVRKSADAFQPEMGEMDFSQELSEVDAQDSTSVRETEETEQTIIRDENRRKHFKYRKRKRKEDEEPKPEGEEEVLVDLQA